MNNINHKLEDGTLFIGMIGHIDSGNAPEVEAAINLVCESNQFERIVIDASSLEYISSAGLRIILRLKKKYDDVSIVEASSEVYEILEITGFSEMLPVTKAYRRISVEGCEVIGKGANGSVIRIDPDTIVKIYHNPNSLEEIRTERELSRAAFVRGIPTAIPYDVVRVGETYGAVYELLNARTLAQILIAEPEKIDEIANIFVELLKKIHSTEVPEGIMPQIRETGLIWAEYLKDYLPEDKYEKLHAMFEAVPESDFLIHGDFHLKNIMMQDGEALIIDMDTLCTGHPVYEFSAIYNAYVGFNETDPDNIKEFFGIDIETGHALYEKIIHGYFADRTEEEIRTIMNKARVISYTRLARREIKHNGLENEKSRIFVDHCLKELLKLLEEVDCLTY